MIAPFRSRRENNMLSASFCCLFTSIFVGATPTQTPEEAAAIRRLKSKGACFDLFPSFCLYYVVEPSPEDRAGFFITIGAGWEGRPKDLRLLNRLRNLRDLAFTHP